VGFKCPLLNSKDYLDLFNALNRIIKVRNSLAHQQWVFIDDNDNVLFKNNRKSALEKLGDKEMNEFLQDSNYVKLVLTKIYINYIYKRL